MRLNNRVAITAGAGAGIGKAVALRYACEGAKVVVAEITIETGQVTADEIHALKGEGVFVCTDVAEESTFAAWWNQPSTTTDTSISWSITPAF